MQSLYTPMEVSKVTSATYRNLKYWDRIGFIKASYRKRGRSRLYTIIDIFKVNLVKELKELGISTFKSKKLIFKLDKLLKDLPYPLKEITILINENRVILTDSSFQFDPQDWKDYIQVSFKQLRDKMDLKKETQ